MLDSPILALGGLGVGNFYYFIMKKKYFAIYNTETDEYLYGYLITDRGHTMNWDKTKNRGAYPLLKSYSDALIHLDLVRATYKLCNIKMPKIKIQGFTR